MFMFINAFLIGIASGLRALIGLAAVIDPPLEPQQAPSFDHYQFIKVRIQTQWRATITATTTAKAKTLIR